MNAKLNKLNDTIAALATAPGRAGLSVVRVSGPLTKNIANKILGYAPKHMQAKYASFKAPGGEIVDSGVALFLAPQGLIPARMFSSSPATAAKPL